jgi:hypothetical protein
MTSPVVAGVLAHLHSLSVTVSQDSSLLQVHDSALRVQERNIFR